MIRLTTMLSLAFIALFLTTGSIEAQLPKVHRIGFLTAASSATILARTEAFRQGLRELGYVEGKNIFIEWRYGDGRLDRVAALAAELVHLEVEVIVTGGTGATRPANEATNTIPIVMTQDQDPVGNGFIVSLARPGGNITGLSVLAPELSAKQLELLKEVLPKASRVAVFGTSTSPSTAQALRDMEPAARALALKLQYLDVRAPKDIEVAFRAAGKERADAVLILGGPVLVSQRTQVIDFAVKSRLPTIYRTQSDVEAGGLIVYGPSGTDLSRRAATYVDKILRGAKPADLPVEQPTKFELAINLKTAKQIGVTISQSMLYRADKVIK